MDDATPGNQNERTALAWQRTALSLMAGSVALSRLTFDRLGALSLLSVVVAVPLSLWIFLESRGRYRHHANIQHRERRRDGLAPAALAVAVIAMGATEVTALLVAA